MTAEQTFWLLFIFVPLTILWLLIMVDILRRIDLLGWHKALWLLAVIFFPWVGALSYVATRPSEATLARKKSRTLKAGPAPMPGTPAKPRSSAPRPATYGMPSPAPTPGTGGGSAMPRPNAPQPSAPRPAAPQPASPQPASPQPAAPGWEPYNSPR